MQKQELPSDVTSLGQRGQGYLCSCAHQVVNKSIIPPLLASDSDPKSSFAQIPSTCYPTGGGCRWKEQPDQRQNRLESCVALFGHPQRFLHGVVPTGTVDSPSLSVRGASDETEGNKVRIIGSLLGRPIDWITQRDSSQRRGALLWLLGSISVSGQLWTRDVLLDFMTRLNDSLSCYSLRVSESPLVEP